MEKQVNQGKGTRTGDGINPEGKRGFDVVFELLARRPRILQNMKIKI
jgi:hypothetical protein